MIKNISVHQDDFLAGGHCCIQSLQRHDITVAKVSIENYIHLHAGIGTRELSLNRIGAISHADKHLGYSGCSQGIEVAVQQAASIKLK
jgi:hypothetical protein